MAELSLKERLQPALFDRLIDEERHITTFLVTVRVDALRDLKLTVDELLSFLQAQGLRLDQEEGADEAAKAIGWRFAPRTGEVPPGRVKAFVIKPSGAQHAVALQTFCTIESRTALNELIGPGARHMISM